MEVQKMKKIVYTGEKDGAFKDTLGKTISGLVENRKDVVYLDADLMGCIGMVKYAKANPERCINVGIAEANMAGIAAGLAAEGFKPIIHSFGPFASRRCYDQVYMSAAYAGNPITIIGSDAGVCAAFNGGTHMPFEDVALYRALPEATVLEPTDTAMLESLLPQCMDRPGVKYLRMGRKNNMKVYETGSEFEIGKSVVLREGKDAVIFACGIMIHEALQAAKTLAEEGIEVAVVDCYSIKPLDTETVLKYASATGAVVVAENHNRIGGLTSAVSEALIGKYAGTFEWVAVDDVFGEVGPQDYLQERFGLTAANVVAKVKKALGK